MAHYRMTKPLEVLPGYEITDSYTFDIQSEVFYDVDDRRIRKLYAVIDKDRQCRFFELDSKGNQISPEEMGPHNWVNDPRTTINDEEARVRLSWVPAPPHLPKTWEALRVEVIQRGALNQWVAIPCYPDPLIYRDLVYEVEARFGKEAIDSLIDRRLRERGLIK